MKTELRREIQFSPCLRRVDQIVAPSLRLAATRRNRALLRWLRAVELCAWQDADTRNPVASRRTPGLRIQPFFRLNHR